MEILLADALPMIAIGAIQDGKTIMLLQHAAIVDWIGCVIRNLETLG